MLRNDLEGMGWSGWREVQEGGIYMYAFTGWEHTQGANGNSVPCFQTLPNASILFDCL